MNSDTLLSDNLDALNLEDKLADFTADLLALKSNQPFLKALFAHPSGHWINLQGLCELNSVKDTLALIEAQGQGQLCVSWLEHPETSPDYCLILFYMNSLGWNSLALYHRSLVEEL